MTHPTPDLELAEQAGSLLRAGDWAGAEDTYRKILAIQQQTGNPGLVAKSEMDLSQFFRLIGRLDEAWDFARAARASARQTGLYPLVARTLRNESSCALARGKTAEALAAASEGLEVIEPGKMAGLMRAQAYTTRAECFLASGQTEAAEPDLAAAWALLGPRVCERSLCSPVIPLAKWCEVQAQLDLRKGHLAEASANLEKAIEHRREALSRSCERSPYPFAALARDLQRLAEVRQRIGDEAGQRQALAEAKELCESIQLPPPSA
jgi:tetratricopeptide (TPR) repeat protein